MLSEMKAFFCLFIFQPLPLQFPHIELWIIKPDNADTISYF